MYYLTALIVGFLGSFHCAGMCGPLALALPVRNGTWSGILSGRLVYNGGRILTYVLFGLVAGLIGHMLVISGFQKALSVSSGVIILLLAAGSLYNNSSRPFNLFVIKYTSGLKRKFRQLLGQRSFYTLFMIGSLNGFLPCGLVYLAVATAASAGSLTGSIGYMALFGIGTLPMMLFISLAGSIFGTKFSRYARQATPYIAIVVAVLLIIRGIMMKGDVCAIHGIM